jgi:hypothetical protein
MPKFKVGDLVEYELTFAGRPRWDMGKDRGSSGGVYETAEVVQISRTFMATRSANITWAWPLENHNHYSPDQWERSGYVRLKRRIRPKYRLINCGGHYRTEKVK